MDKEKVAEKCEEYVDYYISEIKDLHDRVLKNKNVEMDLYDQMIKHRDLFISHSYLECEDHYKRHGHLKNKTIKAMVKRVMFWVYASEMSK